MAANKYCSIYRKKHRQTLLDFHLLKIFDIDHDIDQNIREVKIGHEEMFYLRMIRGENTNFNNFWKLVRHYTEKYDNIEDILKCDTNINVQENDPVNKMYNVHWNYLCPIHIECTKYIFGNTALIYASLLGYTKIVEKLIEAQCGLDITNSCGFTALMEASARGCKEIVKKLVEARCTLDITNIYGCTALMEASAHSYIEIVEILICAVNLSNIHNRANMLDIKNKSGNTALIITSTYGARSPWKNDMVPRVAKKLISARCSLDIQNNYGRSALMEACYYEDIEIVEELIGARCSIELRNILDGRTALDIAIMRKNKEIIDLLTGAKY